MSDLPHFLGRFHPLLVHVPIGLLAAAGGLQLWAWWRGRTGAPSLARAAVGPVLGLAAGGALVAAVAGFLLGTSGGYAGPVFERHKLLGFGLAASAVATAVAWLLSARRPTPALRAVYAVLLLNSLVLLVGAGHAGGSLTHGEGYLTDLAPSWLQTITGNGRVATDDDQPAGQRLAFEALVKPILEERCVSCHGADDPRGGLRLDTVEGIAAGGEGGPVVSAGRPAASPLWGRVSLPAGHPDAMPPRGTRPLTAAEGAVLRWWIAEGASFGAAIADVGVTEELRPTIEALLGPLPPPGRPTLPSARVAAADGSVIASVREAGFSVRPIAEGVPFVQVAALSETVGDDELVALASLAEQLVWLDLGGTGVGDSGLATVGELGHLVRLDLSRTLVTDDGLAHLKDLTLLETLNLYGTRVSDAGLAHLDSLGTLRRLYLWQTNTTAAGLDRLRAALPKLEAERGMETPESPVRGLGLSSPGDSAAGR